MNHRFGKGELSQIEKRGILFDSNILIYLFWPTGGQEFEKTYSSLYNSLLKLDATYYVDFIIISEVVNRVTKIEYKNHLWKTTQESEDYPYKRFRDSDVGKEILNDIYMIIRDSILNNFKVVSKEITEQEIREFLQVDSLDFSDKAIELICQEKNLVLLTNDSDFKFCNIDILSLNENIRLNQ